MSNDKNIEFIREEKNLKFYNILLQENVMFKVTFNGSNYLGVRDKLIQ